jgi:hypothetical protein
MESGRRLDQDKEDPADFVTGVAPQTVGAALDDDPALANGAFGAVIKLELDSARAASSATAPAT